jgi:ribosome-binding factor A
MAEPRRIARLQKLILEVAAETVQRRLKDPRVGFVTLTRTKLAPDLSTVTVYWSCLGEDAARRTSERALADAAPYVQGIVGRAIGTRVTPHLTFEYDPTLAQAHRLEDIFEKLRQERGEPTPAVVTPDTPSEASADTVAEDEPAEDAPDEPDDADDTGDDDEDEAPPEDEGPAAR